MMKASPRFTHYPLQIPFLRTAHDTIDPFCLLLSRIHRSSPCCKQHLHTCAAGSGLRLCVYSPHSLCISSKGNQQDPLPFLLKPRLSQAFCQIKTSALSSACISTSPRLEEKSCARVAPINVQPSVKGARKGTQSGTGAHPHQETAVHRALKFGEERCVDTNARKLKVSKSDASVSACDLNGKSRVTQQKTSIENEKVVHMPSQARSEEKAVNSKTCIEDEKVVDRSSPAREEKEEMNADAFLKNVKISRRFKKSPEAMSFLIKLNLCSKYADLHGAIEVYDQIKREGRVQLNIHSYNVLLYICSGAASGSLVKSKPKKERKNQEATSLQSNQLDHNEIESLEEDTKELVHFSPDDMELAATRGAEILEDMLQQSIEPNEATFTSIVRFAVAKNDGDLAFETVKLMVSSGIPPKLRSYGPPLLCFCESNQVDNAFEVDDHMQEFGVLPDESMLDSLLRVSIEARLENKVYSLLQRLRISVRDLMPTTVKTIEKWFNSEVAASVGKAKWETLPSKEELRQATEACGGGWHGLGWLGKGAWQVKRTNVSKTGSCLSCGERLCTIDLDPEDTENFANSIAKLASQREQQPSGFKAFQEWLDKRGPFDAVVDGANVGLYNPQVYRGFCFMMLNAVVKAAGSKFSTQRLPLVLLHSRHARQLAQTKAEEQVVNKWKKENALYFTPRGSNDDWFWLYAAVKCKGLLITNDKMRDHIFELLGTDFFPKWKERHQVQFTFTAEKLQLHMPPPYSIVIQESQNGSWHIPQAGGDDIEEPREWLCVTRAETLPSV